jgi:hypothetical protein
MTMSSIRVTTGIALAFIVLVSACSTLSKVATPVAGSVPPAPGAGPASPNTPIDVARMAGTWAQDQAIATLANQQGSIPRTAEGKPDFSGFWQALNTANWDIEPHNARVGVPPGLGIVVDGPLPYRPEALAARKANYLERETADTDVKCYMPGVPRIMYEPYPFQISQTPKEIIQLFEFANTKRHIFMNTPHMEGPLEFWMGDSRGSWNGDTLVVDVTYFNADTWFDRSGNFHSEEMHVLERYRFLGPNHVEYEATITDPKVFTRPWKMRMVLYRRVESDFSLLDNECYVFRFKDLRPPGPRGTQ